MKFSITIEYADYSGEAWQETLDDRRVKDVRDAWYYGHIVVDEFNRGLRPGERARRLLAVEVVGESEVHEWRKVNLVTIMDRHGMYDKMQCEHCGITGKRFGIGGNVTRDTKYSNQKYAICRSKAK